MPTRARGKKRGPPRERVPLIEYYKPWVKKAASGSGAASQPSWFCSACGLAHVSASLQRCRACGAARAQPEPRGHATPPVRVPTMPGPLRTFLEAATCTQAASAERDSAMDGAGAEPQPAAPTASQQPAAQEAAQLRQTIEFLGRFDGGSDFVRKQLSACRQRLAELEPLQARPAASPKRVLDHAVAHAQRCKAAVARAESTVADLAGQLEAARTAEVEAKAALVEADAALAKAAAAFDAALPSEASLGQAAARSGMEAHRKLAALQEQLAQGMSSVQRDLDARYAAYVQRASAAGEQPAPRDEFVWQDITSQLLGLVSAALGSAPGAPVTPLLAPAATATLPAAARPQGFQPSAPAAATGPSPARSVSARRESSASGRSKSRSPARSPAN